MHYDVNHRFLSLFFTHREEVLREQFGIRLQSSATTTSSTTPRQPTLRSIVGASSAALLGLDENREPPQEVSPEFLAALPEDVQREVCCFILVSKV